LGQSEGIRFLRDGGQENRKVHAAGFRK
jgi:hypothetical protein